MWSAHCRDIAYEQADRIREEAESDFTIHQEGLDKALTTVAPAAQVSTRSPASHGGGTGRVGPPSHHHASSAGRVQSAAVQSDAPTAPARTGTALSTGAASASPTRQAGFASDSPAKRGVLQPGGMQVSAGDQSAQSDRTAGGRGARAAGAVRGGRAPTGVPGLAGRPAAGRGGSQQRSAALSLPGRAYGTSAAGAGAKIVGAGERVRSGAGAPGAARPSIGATGVKARFGVGPGLREGVCLRGTGRSGPPDR